MRTYPAPPLGFILDFAQMPQDGQDDQAGPYVPHSILRMIGNGGKLHFGRLSVTPFCKASRLGWEIDPGPDEVSELWCLSETERQS